jgi:hypothetical protein
LDIFSYSKPSKAYKDYFRYLRVISMGKIIVTLTEDVEKKLRSTAKTKYGNKRGALSIIVEEALKQYLA